MPFVWFGKAFSGKPGYASTRIKKEAVFQIVAERAAAVQALLVAFQRS